MDTKEILNRTGKTTFIKYYHVFKTENFEYCLNIFEEKYTINSKNTKIRQSKFLFENGLEKQALDLIVNSSKIEECYRQKAQQILNTEFLG